MIHLQLPFFTEFFRAHICGSNLSASVVPCSVPALSFYLVTKQALPKLLLLLVNTTAPPTAHKEGSIIQYTPEKSAIHKAIL